MKETPGTFKVISANFEQFEAFLICTKLFDPILKKNQGAFLAFEA